MPMLSDTLQAVAKGTISLDIPRIRQIEIANGPQM